MSLERMQRDPAHGGFKLLDVKSRFLAFKLQLFTKVINNKSNPLHKYLIKRLTNLEQKTNHSPIFSLKGKFNLPPIINDMIKAARIVKLSCSPTSRITCKTNQLFSKDLFMSPNGSPPQLLTPSLKVIYFCIKTQISNPLSLTKTQQSWINLKNMDLSKIFKFLKKKKAFKPAIKSFYIRLWNNALFFPDTCPACKQQNANLLEHFLFNCTKTAQIYCENHLNTAATFSQPYADKKFNTNIIILYATYNHLMESHFEKRNFSTAQVNLNIRELTKTYKL
jgi:hypothetical protein